MDFNTAWKLARAGQPSGLFATEHAYNYPNPTKRRKTSSFTPPQKSYQRATYHATPAPVWSEYSGYSQHRTPGISPILMEQQSKRAQSVFRNAERTLSKLRSTW
jgi:hypothetical protein